MATFKLDDETFKVKTDPDTGHCLHGGAPSLAKQWHYTVINGENEASVIFYQTSPDMEKWISWHFRRRSTVYTDE